MAFTVGTLVVSDRQGVCEKATETNPGASDCTCKKGNELLSSKENRRPVSSRLPLLSRPPTEKINPRFVPRADVGTSPTAELTGQTRITVRYIEDRRKEMIRRGTCFRRRSHLATIHLHDELINYQEPTRTSTIKKDIDPEY